MKNRLVLSILSFLVILIVVHLIYIGLIRPSADLSIETARQQGLAAPRTLAVLLKDFEQESCIILALWGMFLLLWKSYDIHAQSYLFDVDLFQSYDDSVPDASYLSLLYELEDDEKNTSLVKTLISSLRHFDGTADVQHVTNIIGSSVESTAMKLESGNSLVRYLIWAIPSIGFLGTVRGISIALSEADKALQGDIATMTENLGVAFNSTFVALLCSIFLMALLHLLQHLQDGQVVEIEEYCENHLVHRLGKSKATVSA